MNKINRKFCPECGSDNIKWEMPQMWSIWRCFDCGYAGPIVIEDVEIAEAIKKNYLAKKDQK
jgi:transcription factor S